MACGQAIPSPARLLKRFNIQACDTGAPISAAKPCANVGRRTAAEARVLRTRSIISESLDRFNLLLANELYRYCQGGRSYGKRLTLSRQRR